MFNLFKHVALILKYRFYLKMWIFKLCVLYKSMQSRGNPLHLRSRWTKCVGGNRWKRTRADNLSVRNVSSRWICAYKSPNPPTKRAWNQQWLNVQSSTFGGLNSPLTKTATYTPASPTRQTTSHLISLQTQFSNADLPNLVLTLELVPIVLFSHLTRACISNLTIIWLACSFSRVYRYIMHDAYYACFFHFTKSMHQLYTCIVLHGYVYGETI
jgi:hypothetical protein